MATDAEVAAHLDLSDRSVRDLRKRGALPLGKRGEHDINACRVAYIRHLRERAAGRASDAADDDDLDLVKERARLAKEQADKLASENSLTRGELVPITAVTTAVLSVIELSKSRLMRVPAIVAKSDVALKERIATVIQDALEDLSATRVEAMAGGEADDGDDEPS